MLIKAKNILGLKIITVDHGKEIDKVREIIYDPDQHKVQALLIDEGGMFSDAKVIPFQQIKSIGEDAVLIHNEGAVRKASEVTQKVADIAKHGAYLTKTKIITEGGKELGHVTDILFDDSTGAVEEFIVSQGGLTDIGSGQKHVRVDDIITIGKDATIVKTFTEQDFAAQSEQKGLKGAFNQAKDSVPTQDDMRYQWTLAKNAGQEKTNEPGTQQKVDTAKQNIKTANEKVQTAVQDTVDTVKNKIATVQNNMNEDRKKSTAGKYLTKNILVSNNQLLAKRGDMVTYDLIDRAESNGVVDEVFNNVTTEPLNS